MKTVTSQNAPIIATVASPQQHDDTVAMRWPVLKLLRPKQWIKNTLVFAPLIFTGSFFHYDALTKSAVAALLFCVASSASYILNDLRDLKFDRQHPQKKYARPLAAGKVSTRFAIAVLVALYLTVALSFFYQPPLALALYAYLLINIAYSYALKNIPVIDLFTIASGFVLRVYAGALSLAVPLSFWMFITTLCLALYLAATKRRQELHLHGAAARSVLRVYTVPLLDYYAQLAAIGAIVFYGLFVATVRPSLAITIPLVLFGLFRYRFIVEIKSAGESPTEVLWKDVPLIITTILWALASIYELRTTP